MSTTLSLPEKLDTRAAEDLAAMLGAQEPGDLRLDGTSVARLGALCGQILWALQADRAAQGASVTIAASEAMAEDLRLLGLAADLVSEGDDT